MIYMNDDIYINQ